MVIKALWQPLQRLMARLFYAPQPVLNVTALPLLAEPEQVGTLYKRSGYCNGCGHCCQNVSLTFNNTVVQSEAQFQSLKERHPSYQAFVLQGETEQGLLFKCSHLNEANLCRIYEDRPHFCKNYPTEAGLILGGKLPTDCSYEFKAIKSFDFTLQEAQQNNRF